MDSITHGMYGAAIAIACLSKKSKKKTLQIGLAGFLVGNFPDIDIILAFIDSQIYAQEHRGLTHSFIGLPFLSIISAFFISKFLNINYKKSYITSLLIILFAHITPDFLTVYGVMLFYPFDRTYYHYSIIFIIDLMIWGTTLLFIISNFIKRDIPIKLAKIYISLVLIINTTYAGIRTYITHDVEKNINANIKIASPTIFPFFSWNIVAEKNNKIGRVNYDLIKIPFLRKKTKMPDYINEPIFIELSNEHEYNNFKNPNKYNLKAKNKLEELINKNSHIACKEIETGSKCYSLKYSLISNDGAKINDGFSTFTMTFDGTYERDF